MGALKGLQIFEQGTLVRFVQVGTILMPCVTVAAQRSIDPKAPGGGFRPGRDETDVLDIDNIIAAIKDPGPLPRGYQQPPECGAGAIVQIWAEQPPPDQRL